MSNDIGTMTLADFLLARIAEDGEDARQTPDGEECMECHGFSSGSVDTYDPARVLAECEAKRRIVEDLKVPAEHAASTGGGRHFRLTLRLLALPYADHSDYREEWRP